MSGQIVRHGYVNQGGTFITFARITGLDGEPIDRASVQSVDLIVTDVSEGTQTGDATPQVSSVVFDELQTNDQRWTADSTGYNFRHTVPASMIPEGDRDYRAEYKLSMADGSTVWAVFGVWAHRVYGAG